MAVAFFDLGPLNNVVMLTVAVVKAMFVVLYFMHVRWGSRTDLGDRRVRLLLAADHVSFTLMDYMSRGWLQGTLR